MKRREALLAEAAAQRTQATGYCDRGLSADGRIGERFAESRGENREVSPAHELANCARPRNRSRPKVRQPFPADSMRTRRR